MEFLGSTLIGYIIGSFPTAYILLKKFKSIDITQNGSGNVGALNSLKVSKSKSIGAFVLIIDLLKGLLAVYLVKLLFGDNFILSALALIAAVFSHCFNPWLKFKGGRGLATAAGGAILLSPPVLGLWLLLWGIAFIFKRHVHFANFSATVLTAALAFSSVKVLNYYSTPPASENLEFSISIAVLLSIILMRHIEPIKEYIKNWKKSRGNENEKS
ncbi:MAG: glycerol-3-phosphate acyltransferase [Melioribacteraceae bacterium]|jgi:glycerol-3-phosphate acyltransferase PlsY|nr:glycerol-3-phosphate acyltransferase [Melioribacteraceae bacterium]